MFAFVFQMLFIYYNQTFCVLIIMAEILRYQNRRLNWYIQWGQTGISLAACLLVEYCCGSLRKLLRGYICPGLSRSKEWIEKKIIF